jgi:hypothetical protein
MGTASLWKIAGRSIHRKQNEMETNEMTIDKDQNALKNGAFSKVNFMPGEDPQDYVTLKADLFAEYKPCGRSQEKLVTSVSKALWKLKRVQRSSLIQ